MSGQKLPLCELKDGIDLAISKFVKESKLEDMIPNELRFFLPKIYEAEAEATVEKIVKFRTKPSQVLRITRKAKGISSTSFQDAFEKAKKEANILAQPDIENHAKTLQKSVDVGSINDTICGLDSSTLDEYIKKMDENKYELIKDLNITELDLEIKKGETLTIPIGIALTNKKNIINSGKLQNLGLINNQNEINSQGGEFSGINSNNYKGKLPNNTNLSATSTVSWPSGTDLFSVSNNKGITINNKESPSTYTITQNSSSEGTTTITLNQSQLPAGTTGFYFTNIETIGGGGGGGGAVNRNDPPSYYLVGNGGCGGANIVTSTLNSSTSILLTNNPLEIIFNTGSGGQGGVCPTLQSDAVANFGLFTPNTSAGAGSVGGDSYLEIIYNNNIIFRQEAEGGEGGYVVNITNQINYNNSFDSSCKYNPLPNSTSQSYQYYDFLTGQLISNPTPVNGYSGGYGGMSYNASYSNTSNTNGQSPSAGSYYGAGGGSGVAQGSYPDRQGGNPYSGAQAGGGGGGVSPNVGGLGYSYYTAGDGANPIQPTPSFGGGGGGAGILWIDGGYNSGQDGGSGYNSLSITFVQESS